MENSKSKISLILFCWLSLHCTVFTPATSIHRLYIWNVGQGQWLTLKNHLACWHFDAGGEYAPFNKISKLCSNKKNYIYLSHGDWDHIRFLAFFRKKRLSTCLKNFPQEQLSIKKQNFIEKTKFCKSSQMPDNITEIKFDKNYCHASSTSNCKSRIFYLSPGVLIPGDSTRKAELFWSRYAPQTTKWLILGHHGSHTSTSPKLLNQLPELKQAFVSARRKKYGHPHRSVVRSLKKRKIPLLSTEHWGTIIIEL